MTIMSLLLNYLISALIFAALYIIERLFLLWFKKKPLLPIVSHPLLVDAIAYTALAVLLIGIIHIAFKKVDILGLVWLDITFYILIKLIKPSALFFSAINKEKIQINRKHILGAAFFVVILLECFLFNAQAYSGNKEVYQYNNFISESISSDGNIESNKITLSNKQCIYINTDNKNYDNFYLSFDNSDMNLYINIFELKNGSTEYTFKKYVLIDPKYDAFGYISLDSMEQVKTLKLEFDIDDSRYLNNQTKPLVVVTAISFDEYFPLIINPLRLGLIFGVLLIGFNFKKMFISNKVKEDTTVYQKLEKIVLFGGASLFIIFVIQALFNNSAYFIKYDELFLGGTSSNNIYYQQFAAYLKGQLHLDVPVDEGLLSLSNPYDPSKRAGLEVLWDHAFYNGKYYSYYGHAPIYLVMFPIYLVSGYVPSNLFILQLGVLFSIFTFLLAALEVIKFFIKKINAPILVLSLIAMVFGSFLLTNNTYEYGGMIYRIPYAYANGFLFLTIYLFLKGYHAQKFRFLYFLFTGFSVVFLILSRPLEAIYLILFAPLIVKLVKEGLENKKRLLIDWAPGLGVVLVGAILVCIMNYVRFENIFEFGEHYQLTVMDCRNNKLDIDGLLPTLYHYFLQAPEKDKINHLLIYREAKERFDIHPYNTLSVGLLFAPITAFVLLIPYIWQKEDGWYIRAFIISSPFLVFFVAFINYCFAGVCPRYLNDFAPWAALSGALVALKALEKDNGKHFIVPSFISVILIASIVLSSEYHFIAFDGLRIGDFGGLLSLIKSITNQYNL